MSESGIRQIYDLDTGGPSRIKQLGLGIFQLSRHLVLRHRYPHRNLTGYFYSVRHCKHKAIIHIYKINLPLKGTYHEIFYLKFCISQLPKIFAELS